MFFKHPRQEDNLLKKIQSVLPDSAPLRQSSVQPSSIFDRDFLLQEIEFKFVEAITYIQWKQPVHVPNLPTRRKAKY